MKMGRGYPRPRHNKEDDMKRYTCLYFVSGYAPSPSDLDVVKGYPEGLVASFRNANFVSSSDPLEKADCVDGEATPSHYRDAYPDASDFSESLRSSVADADEKVKKTAKRAKKLNREEAVEKVVFADEIKVDVEDKAGWKPN